jgi:hypothetical protein
MVPLPELIETRRRAQEAERRLQAEQRRIDQLEETVRRFTQPQQPQPQPIDPEIDPAGALNALRQEMYQNNLSTRLDISERYAREKYGSDVVDAALDAAAKSGYAQSFVNRPDAYGEMVKWHQGNRVYEEIGSDPTAYREKLKAELRTQLLAEMRQGTPPPSNLTPSLSQATKANGAPEVVGSDKDFFRQMMNQRRGG